MGDRSLAESDRCMGDRSLAESASTVRLLVGAMPATSRCSQRNAHLVALVTGYQRAFATQGDLQHLLPGAKHAFPQQPPPLRFLHSTDFCLHWVSLLTGYHALLGPWGLQHLLPGAKQAFPQQPPPFPWHGKLSPFTFSQHTSFSPTQAPPQHLSPPAHVNGVPSLFLQCTGGLRRREVEFTASSLRNANSELSSPLHSPAVHSGSICMAAALPMRRAMVTIFLAAISCADCLPAATYATPAEP